MAQAPRARLGEYREQSGAISFRIVSAPDFSATIAELKQRIPQWARQYNGRTSEWRVKTEYRDVLEEIFINVPSLHGASARGGGFEEEGPRSQWLWAALALLIIVTAGAVFWARGDETPADSAALTAEAEPARAAQSAAPLFQPQQAKVTSVVNLRAGPGTNFEVRAELKADSPIVAVARQQADDGYWWLLLQDGAWVRSDLVVSTAAGELPLDLSLLPDTKNAGAGAYEAQTEQPADAQAAQAAQATTSANAPVEAVVTWVSDGNTVHVQIAGREYRVRYIGVRAPERDEPNYQAASDANGALVGGKTVLLARDVSESDSLGRLLRYVYLPDGTFVNEALVRKGWAAVAIEQPDVAQAAALQSAEQQARSDGVGIWAAQ